MTLIYVHFVVQHHNPSLEHFTLPNRKFVFIKHDLPVPHPQLLATTVLLPVSRNLTPGYLL